MFPLSATIRVGTRRSARPGPFEAPLASANRPATRPRLGPAITAEAPLEWDAERHNPNE